MLEFVPGADEVEERPQASEDVVLDVVNHPASGDASVSRRRALKAGATALVGAAVVVATATDAGTAFGSTAGKKKAVKKKAASRAKHLTIHVNGKSHVVTNAPDTMLLYVLRNEVELRGPRFGCGLSQCGACAVLLDGKQIRSCVTPVAGVAFADGKNKITTVEGLPALWTEQRSAAKKTKSKKKGHVESHFGVGLEVPTKLHPVQQAWIDQQVPQCGYCQSGMMIQAVSLLSTHLRPTEAEIKRNMNGHLCRCGTYTAIIEGIQEASKTMAKELA
jgi:aerobic-type carbon monoxide dehydrogenase small subunit (CoxS/CutS family)